MKEFSIPIKITLNCSLSVEANNQDEAYEVADDTMYWAYQNGAPEQHKDLSILDCEIAVDGEDIDLDECRDLSDTDS
jgi:hypothetical protein